MKESFLASLRYGKTGPPHPPPAFLPATTNNNVQPVFEKHVEKPKLARSSFRLMLFFKVHVAGRKKEFLVESGRALFSG